MSDIDVRVTRWWVDTYTRSLPADVRSERRDVIASDVYEQLSSAARVAGRGTRAAVVGRTARGVVDDLVWRHGMRKAMKHQSTADGQPVGIRAAWAAVTQSWFTPAAALLCLFNLLLAVGILLDKNSTMPGRVVGPMFLLAFATSMAVGLRLRWVARQTPRTEAAAPRRFRPVFVLIPLLIAVAAAVGINGGISPVIIIAVALVLAAVVSLVGGRKTAAAPRSSSPALADVLMVMGTLPGLAFFWIVIPALLGIVVIAGVIGTGARRSSGAVA